MEYLFILVGLVVLGIGFKLWNDVVVEAKVKATLSKYPSVSIWPESRFLHRFEQFTQPTLPIKRELTDNEHRVMRRFYSDFIRSDVDAKGRIILNAGEYSDSTYYITEEELVEMVKCL